jgi:arylsulfatase A-like enzyme/Flp pilus assembly protein TadD
MTLHNEPHPERASPASGAAPRAAGRLRRIAAAGLILAGAAVLAVALVPRLAPGRRPAAPHPIPRAERSVVLVTMDTTRPDRLEPYGARDVATPNLGHLAERGVTFEHAYAAAPITLVAHASILTGLDPPRHGVRTNGLHRVPEEVTTLAERLRERGFRTAAFVSAAVLDRRYRLDQGFEVYDDDLSGGRERHPRMVADRPAEVTVVAARAWLDGLGEGERFFLWVHLYDPHAAYSPPPPYRHEYRGRLYDGEIAYMDAEIGELLRHPRVGGEALILALADHAESLGEHGEQTHGLLAYDSTLHIPWLLAVPGAPAGARIETEVGQVDVVPTVLDLLGLEPEPDLPGASLVPLLEGSRADLRRPLYAESFLPFYTYGWAQLRVLRSHRLKWIDAPTPELYDLRRDPRELSNLAEQEPGLAADLARQLAELTAAGGAEHEEPLTLGPDELEQLRSLGYVQAGSRAQTGREQRPDPKDVLHLHLGLERARTLIGDRLFEAAAGELRRVLAEDPANLAALLELAGALVGQGELDEALEVAEHALAVDPEYAQIYLLLADLEERRGEPERALTLLETALGLEASFQEAVIQKALLLERLGRAEEAGEVLRAGLEELGPEPRLEAVYAGVVEMRRGAFEEAEERLRRALEHDPFLVAGWRLLGELLEKTGRAEEARDAYARGLERQPDDADLHARLGLLLARRWGDPQAEAHLLEAIRLSAEPRPELHVALGAWLAERGRFGEAVAQYEQVLAKDPRDPMARNNRAIAYYHLGRPAEARSELLQLVEEHPRFADAHNNLAVVALDRRDFASAARHARRAAELAPAMAEAWNNLGLALVELSDAPGARRAYERALAGDPTYWRARFNLALLLSSSGECGGAAALLEEVIRQQPALPEAHLELGSLYAGSLARPEAARAHFNAFLRYAPQHPRAEEIRRWMAAPGPLAGACGEVSGPR